MFQLENKSKKESIMALDLEKGLYYCVGIHFHHRQFSRKDIYI